VKRIFILLLSLFFSTCAFSSSLRIKVTKVIDGDTVKLENGQFLRYIGIDTPEIEIKKNSQFVYQPQLFSLPAKEFNKKLVEGKLVRIEFDVEKVDSYGRLLGYCFVGDTFVNAELLKKGYAILYTRPPNIKYVDLFVKLQKEAREKKKGIWGALKPISSDEAYKFIHQIKTVRGKVVDTYQSKRCIFLNFGKDYTTDFTVVIFKDSWKYFKERNINPLTFYKGKLIEVTGKLREYNGPEIIVHFPEEINIVGSR